MDDSLQFESDVQMVALARAFVRDRLASWGVTDGLDAAVLIASELVSNAVLHARTSIQLRLRCEDRAVRLEVYDENSRLPAIAATSADATSGRGLTLVSAFADAWGIDDQSHGKVVWAEVGRVPRPPVRDCVDLTGVATVDQALAEIGRKPPQ